MESIFSTIITPGMAGLAAAAIAIMLFIGRVPWKDSRINQMHWWKEWGEFILMAVCIGGSFAPGVTEIPAGQWGAKLVFAAVTALVAHLGRKILKPIIIARLESKDIKSESESRENSNEN